MDVFEVMQAARVVPVVRKPSVGEALELCERLLGAGLPVLELTATTPQWATALRQLRDRAVVGVGTITTADDARRAADEGAGFFVSPYPAASVRAVAVERGVPFIEGGFTPGELASASAAGVAKLFPAAALGIGYLKSVLDVLPGARIIPTGGIALDQVEEWLAAGAFAVGVGSSLATRPDAADLLRRLRER